MKSKLGVVVSQPGELSTAFKSPLVIGMGMCIRDGGKCPIWSVEPVLPIFAIFTKSFFFLTWCFPKSLSQDIMSPFLQAIKQKRKKREPYGRRGKPNN